MGGLSGEAEAQSHFSHKMFSEVFEGSPGMSEVFAGPLSTSPLLGLQPQSEHNTHFFPCTHILSLQKLLPPPLASPVCLGQPCLRTLASPSLLGEGTWIWASESHATCPPSSPGLSNETTLLSSTNFLSLGFRPKQLC
jgi:hypothetical protein